MARRKSNRDHRAPPSAVPNPFAIDHESSHREPKTQPLTDHPSNDSTPKTLSQKDSNKTGAGRSSSLGISSGDEADEDDDAAEEDEDEDDDDENGDAIAPSDSAIGVHGDQAGHIGIEQCDSDDEVYNAVDNISDSDDGEPGVEKLEERDIIQSVEGNDCGRPATFPRPVSEASDIWEGFDVDNGFFTSDMPYLDEQLDRSELGLLDSEIEMFQSTIVFDDPEPMPSLTGSPSPMRRRVHFNEPIFPPSDSSVTGDEDLNGLFNPAEIPSMEADLDFDNTKQENDDDEDGSSVGSSSGYESG